MSVNSKMTAIADAIREKTGGTEPLSLDQMAIDITNISSGGFSVDAIQAIYDDFSYTGRILREVKIMDGVPYVLFILETSGTLTVNGNYTGDVWLCGGGGLGGTTSTGSTGTYGGGGGGGGYTANAYHVALESGEVLIGAGGESGNGGTSSYLSHTAAGGKSGNGRTGGAGGCGGGGGGRSAGGAGQGTTTRPFESQDMEPQCGGGAGAIEYYGDAYGTVRYYRGGHGGSDGQDGETPSTEILSTQSWTAVGGYRGGGYRTAGPNAQYAGRFNGMGYGGGGAGGYDVIITTGQKGYRGLPGAVIIRIAI